MAAWHSAWSRALASLRRGIARDVVQAVHEDVLYDVAAGLAFHALLALVPFLLLCILLVGVVLDEQSSGAVESIVAKVAPSTVVPQTVHEVIHALAFSARNGFLIVAIAVAAWTASKATWALVRALNRVFHSRETRPLLHQRIVALAVTTCAGLLAAAAVVVEAGLPLAASHFPLGGLRVVRWFRLPVTGGLAALAWTALYRLLPARSPRLGIPSAGSIVGVAAWMLASWGFSAYLEHVKDFGALYGTFGGVLVLLLWLWMSCFALLVGAVVDRLHAERSRR
jgi:membrane protein